MRSKLSLALVGLVIAALASPAVSTAAPALTLTKNCSQYPPFHGVNVSLTGLPPNTPFDGTLGFPSGGSVGPASFTTDASGNFFLGPFGSSVPGTFTATVVWSGGTLVTSLDVNCAVPTSREQCKNGGWQAFGFFRNQGDCVSFVATGGKNPPSG